MRIKNLFKLFSVFLLVSLFGTELKASHLYGAEFTYEYIGPSGNPTNPFQYRILYKIYRGANAGSNVNFQFYQKSTGAPVLPQVFNNITNQVLNGTLTGGFNLNAMSTVGPLPLPIPPGCSIPNLPAIYLWTYDLRVNLPLSFDGYYVTADIFARNNDITNLQSPGSTALFSYMQVPSPLLPSKSPVFTDTAVVVMFAGDTTSIINSAFDSDGDKLIYSFNQPFDNGNYTTFIPSSSIPARISYASSPFNYSLNNPFGSGGFAKLNASTGLATYYSPRPGNYVVSFQVQEWRNVNGIDVLIGTTIRDIQLVVRTPPANNNTPPNISYTGTNPIIIREGQAIPPITFTFTDPNPGDNIRITATSASLLDGPGNKNAFFNSSTTNTVINGPSGTTATFTYTSVCGDANQGGYPLNITASDGVCGTSPDQETITIIVLPYQGPQQIFGDTTVCSNANELYNITGKASANYNWRLQGGGTIIGNTNNDSIRVQWSTPGRYRLTAIETSTGSCVDSVSFFVNVSAGQAVSVSPAQTICAGGTATLTATGGTGFTWTDGANTFTGASISVSPTATTTYTVTGTSTPGGCIPTGTVQVTVNPLPVIQPGVNRTICAGDQTTLTATGAATYSWSDGTTTLTGNNLNVSPTATTTYTVTGTTAAGCTNTSQVTVTVNPLPVVSLASIGNAYCANDAAVALDLTQGTYTVNGTPITGSTFNPASFAPGNYTVAVSKTENNCTTTASKAVTINAVPAANFGTLGTTYCKDATPVSLAIAGSTFLVNGSAPVNNEFNPATLGAGTHTVSVTTTNAQNCSVTETRTVTVVEAIPNFGGLTAAAYCRDAAAITAPANSTYSINGGTPTTTFNPASLPAGNHTVSVTTTNGACSATSSRQVTINAIPQPSLAFLNTSYCANDAAITLDPAQGSYTLNGSPVTGTTFNPSTLGPGTYTVGVTKTENNCTGTNSKTITVKPVPAANFGTLATEYCKNDAPVSLAIAGSVFTIDGGTTPVTTFDPASLTVGTHTVSVTTTSTPDNCSITATRTITIHALPTPSLAFLNTSYCANNPAVTLPAGTGISYAINGTGVSSLNPATMNIGTNTVSITETNANNCTVTTSRTITVNPAPLTDNIAGAISVCPGISGIRYSIVNPRETTYQWSIPAGMGTIVSGQGSTSILVNWGTTAGAASVSAQAQNTFGCLGTAATLPVNITQILATPQPVGPTSICLNQANQVRYVMTNPTTGSTFTWSIPGATINSNTRGDTVLVTFTTAGTHNIVVQESSTGSSVSGPVNCFGNSLPFPVTILASPSATLPVAGPSEVCVDAGSTAYSLTGAPTTSSYAWTLTKDGITNPVTGSTASVQFNPSTGPGQYTLAVTETNAAGCIGTPITKVITVTPKPVLTQIQGPAFVCPENLNNILYYVASVPGQTFTWNITGGSLATPANGNDSVYVNFSSNAPVRSVTVTPLSPTQALCAGDPVTHIITLDPATLELQVASTTEQNEKTISLNLQMPGNSANSKQIDVYRREVGTAAFAKVGTIANTAISFTDNAVQTSARVYEYYLESRNECGTVLRSNVHNTMLLDVLANEEKREVYLRWNSYKGWNPAGVKGYQIFGQADNGNFEFLREVGVNDTVVTLSNISSKGFNQCFRVKAVSNDTRLAASWSNSACITFENPLVFFNIFTPNNDGRNDQFVVENIKLYPGNELAVFNRWGKEVYRKKDYDNTWDGKNLADGTYYYYLTLKDGRSFKGWVEIVR